MLQSEDSSLSDTFKFSMTFLNYAVRRDTLPYCCPHDLMDLPGLGWAQKMDVADDCTKAGTVNFLRHCCFALFSYQKRNNTKVINFKLLRYHSKSWTAHACKKSFKICLLVMSTEHAVLVVFLVILLVLAGCCRFSTAGAWCWKDSCFWGQQCP